MSTDRSRGEIRRHITFRDRQASVLTDRLISSSAECSFYSVYLIHFKVHLSCSHVFGKPMILCVVLAMAIEAHPRNCVPPLRIQLLYFVFWVLLKLSLLAFWFLRANEYDRTVLTPIRKQVENSITKLWVWLWEAIALNLRGAETSKLACIDCPKYTWQRYYYRQGR